MVSKELESSRLNSFSMNLTNIFKVIDKCRRKIIFKYCQKLLFFAWWGLTIMFIIFWDFLMCDKIFPSFKFCCVVPFFTWKLEFVSNILWTIAASRYTNADLKICEYLRLHMKIICWIFHIKTSFPFGDMHTWECKKFVYKRSETKEYVKN